VLQLSVKNLSEYVRNLELAWHQFEMFPAQWLLTSQKLQILVSWNISCTLHFNDSW